MPTPVLNRDQAAERLAECAEEIRSLGVVRLAVFGSVLREQATTDSDIDMLVQFAPAKNRMHVSWHSPSSSKPDSGAPSNS